MSHFVALWRGMVDASVVGSSVMCSQVAWNTVVDLKTPRWGTYLSVYQRREAGRVTDMVT